MSHEEEISELKQRIADLETVIREITAAMKLLTEKDERAKRFLDSIDKIVSKYEHAIEVHEVEQAAEDDGRPTR